jgi:hypothetical protein
VKLDAHGEISRKRLAKKMEFRPELTNDTHQTT